MFIGGVKSIIIGMSGTKRKKSLKKKRAKNRPLWDFKKYFTPRAKGVIYFDFLTSFS